MTWNELFVSMNAYFLDELLKLGQVREMKKAFPGYYRPSEKEFLSFWNDCIFVFDANMLLNFYRYSQATSEELIGILRQVQDRLWIPHQAALEYQENRINEIMKQLDAYDTVQTELDKTKKQLDQTLRSSQRHPYINVDYLSGRIKEAFTDVSKDLERLKEEHPNLLQHDTIRETLDQLIDGKIGSPFEVGRLNEIYKEGKQRYEQEIPPGFKDLDKEGNRKYGDLVLWFQIIDKAKETKKPIILVTDDRKEDWWLRIKGKTIGPHPKLVEEMLSEAGVQFYLYKTDPFMEFSQKYLKRQVKQKAIDEIRDIRKSDEEKEMVKSIDTLRYLPSEDEYELLRSRTFDIPPSRLSEGEYNLLRTMGYIPTTARFPEGEYDLGRVQGYIPKSVRFSEGEYGLGRAQGYIPKSVRIPEGEYGLGRVQGYIPKTVQIPEGEYGLWRAQEYAFPPKIPEDDGEMPRSNTVSNDLDQDKHKKESREDTED